MYIPSTEILESQLFDRLIASVFIRVMIMEGGGTAMAQWLRCCATNQKIAGSILDGVIGTFH